VKKQDPAMMGPTAWQGGGTNSGQSTITTNAPAINYEQVIAEFYKYQPDTLKTLSSALKKAGYSVKVTSKPTNDLRDQFLKANADFILYNKFNPSSTGLFGYLSAVSDSGAGGAGGPRVSKSVRLSDSTTAEALVTAVMQDQVGRGPSKAELNRYTQALQKAQAAAPTTTVTTGGSATTTSQTTGGINEQQFLINEIAGTDEARAQKVKSFYDVFKQAIGVS